jgi:hypothetical protein
MSAVGQYVHRNFIQLPFPAIRAGKASEPVVTTDAGALDANSSLNQIKMVSGSNKVQTLADGDEGQVITVYLKSKGGAGSAVVTPAHLAGGTTITLSAAGQFAMLAFLAGKWQIIASTGTLA